MSRRPLSPSSLIAAAAAVIALGLPGLASAEYWHLANNEAGVVVHPEHFQSTKTRAQVRAEAAAALQQGCLPIRENNYPCATPGTGPGKTRAQVVGELLNESAAARAARMSLIAN